MMKYLAWPLRFRRTHSASIPQVPQALLRSWEENGFVILPNFYNSTEIDAVGLDLRNTWTGGTPRVVVDDLVTRQAFTFPMSTPGALIASKSTTST